MACLSCAGPSLSRATVVGTGGGVVPTSLPGVAVATIYTVLAMVYRLATARSRGGASTAVRATAHGLVFGGATSGPVGPRAAVPDSPALSRARASGPDIPARAVPAGSLVRRGVVATPAAMLETGTASTAQGRAVGAGTGEAGTTGAVRRIERADERLASGAAAAGVLPGTLRVVVEAFAYASTRPVVSGLATARTVTAPTSVAAPGPARTVPNAATEPVTLGDRSLVVCFIAAMGPLGPTGLVTPPGGFRAISAAALRAGETSRGATPRFACRIRYDRILTSVKVIVAGRPRRCSPGTDPSTCPSMGAAVAGRLPTTPTAEATCAVLS